MRELSREENVEMATLAKMAMRYKDMMVFMKNIITKVDVDQLTSGELYLFAYAYKNVIRVKVASLRLISFTLWSKTCLITNHDQPDSIEKKYTTYIEWDLYQICRRIFKILTLRDSYLVHHTLPPDSEKSYIRDLSDALFHFGAKSRTDIIILCDGILNLLHSGFQTPNLTKESISYVFSDYFYVSTCLDYYYTRMDEYKKAEIGIAKMASQLSRQENTHMAKLALEANRYEDVIGLLKPLVEIVAEPTEEECNLLFLAYKNVIQVKWTSWNIIFIHLSKQNKINRYVSTIKKYKSMIETEFKDIYHDLLNIHKALEPSMSEAYLDQLSLQDTVSDTDMKTFEDAEGAESSGGKLYQRIEELMQLFQGKIKRMDIESPIRPREELTEKQKYSQNIHKPPYLKGPLDTIISAAIHLGLALVCGTLIGRGISNMKHGTKKKE